MNFPIKKGVFKSQVADLSLDQWKLLFISAATISAAAKDGLELNLSGCILSAAAAIRTALFGILGEVFDFRAQFG